MYLNTSAVYAIRLTQPNSLKNFPSKITSFMKKKAMLARPCTFRACFPKTYYLRQWRRRSNNKHKNVHFYRMENYGVEGNILAYSHYLVADEKLQEILFWKNWEKDQILYAGFLYYHYLYNKYMDLSHKIRNNFKKHSKVLILFSVFLGSKK